jgi:hypothetical protein
MAKQRKKLRLATVIRRALYTHEQNGEDKIAMIKSIRRDTACGLKDAMDFADFLISFELGTPHAEIAEAWCEEHWCPAQECVHGAPSWAQSEEATKVEIVELTPKPKAKAKAVEHPEFRTYVTTSGLCGHELADGKCRFINHNNGKGVNQ